MNNSWSEPSILWTLSGSEERGKEVGSNKTDTRCCGNSEKNTHENYFYNIIRTKSNLLKERIIDLAVEQFSFEQLHSVMPSNNCTALSLYDEMSTMYEQLDIYKHAGSRQDKYTLLKLYNAGLVCLEQSRLVFHIQHSICQGLFNLHFCWIYCKRHQWF